MLTYEKVKPTELQSGLIIIITMKNLVVSGVTQYITFHYDYDNGRVSEVLHYIIIWLENGVGF